MKYYNLKIFDVHGLEVLFTDFYFVFTYRATNDH